MAYVNVAEWKPDQVTEWLKGLDTIVLPYIQSFLNNRITGQQILGFGPSDLELLGVKKIGHQEIILEGIDHLRSIHYELDRENLQLLAMRLSCLSHSLHNELNQSHTESQRLTTQILADIANIVTCVKPLIAWLDRPGFSGQLEYTETRSQVLSLGLRMAICGQRDRFAEAPVIDMRDASSKLAKLTDSIVQDMTDPLILQPASLELATVKKRSSDDLGFYIVPSFRGVHQVSSLKLNSPAHQCGKIEPGDEIIQINYQTVVGWDVKQVMHLFAESPTEVLLTLKKRPKHTKVYGQIYVKPYRLPSKKRAIHSHGFPPRLEPLTRLHFRVPLHTLKIPIPDKVEKPAESRDSSSSDEEVTVQHKLVVPSKPVHISRRATITGASPLSKRPPFDIQELWHDLKLEKESCIKQSATSVVDFEERLSSVDKTTTMQHSPRDPEPVEALSIKQKIQMFSREQNLERQKPPVRKQQIRINSEPIFDNKALDEAVRMMRKSDNTVTVNNKLSDSDDRNSLIIQEDNVPAKSLKEKEISLSSDKNVSSTVLNLEDRNDSPIEVVPTPVERNVGAENVVVITPSSPPPPTIRLLPTFPEPPKEPYFEIPQSMKTHEQLIKGTPLHLYRELETQKEEAPSVAPRFFESSQKNEVSVIHSSQFRDAQTQKDEASASYTNHHNETVISVNMYPDSRVQNEEHGKVVQTINQHLLASTFCDESDLLECRSYGKNLDVGVSDKFKSSSSNNAGGFEIVSSSSKRMECDSELSRTISRVNTEDIINNKEHIGSTKVVVTQKNSFPNPAKKQEFLPPKTIPKVSNIDKSYSNDSINRLHSVGERMASHSAMRSDVSLDSFLESAEHHPRESKYSSLQEKHLRAAYKDCCDSFSNKSYSSSEYSEHSMASRTAEILPPERQTLPKVGAKHTAQSPPVPPPRPSLSKPPNACYRAIMAARSLGKASPKTQRKKNALLSKRRKIAVKDFSSVECDGWLLQRCRKGSGTWIKRWCLIHANTLYTFKTKSASKAETMVYLPGFTVSPAEEVKSRPFAFKVYHTGTMFYFAAETNFELSVWLDAISTATLEQNTTSQEVLYSESEGEMPRSEAVSPEPRKQPLPTPVATSSPNPPSSSGDSGSKMFGSLKKLGSRNSKDSTSSKDSGGSSLDRKCLRILGTGPLPVPTAQYRSYRRVHNTPPPPPPTSCPSSKESQDQPHSALPPEMADYRLASLTAKTTPPVPRRRVVPREMLQNENRRPHISAPILNPLPPGLDERTRALPLHGRPIIEYRNHSVEPHWIESLRRSDNGRRKVKTKKHLPINQAGPSGSQMRAEGAYGLQSPGTPSTIPELEYPPVFEPDTYTLDTLLHRTRNHPKQ